MPYMMSAFVSSQEDANNNNKKKKKLDKCNSKNKVKRAVINKLRYVSKM